MVVGWVIAVGMLIAGGAMVRVGVRGRRVDDHPVCRGCGFDLVGLPEESGVCSECGADVKRKGAVRVGNRERRWGWVAAGMGLVMPSVLGMGLTGWAVVRGVNVNEYKPVWWLVGEAKGGNAVAQTTALWGLIGRVNAGRLSAKEAEGIVEEALRRQVDASREWVPGWGIFVERAQMAGLVGKEQWRRYARQSAGLMLRVRPRVRRGDGVPVQIGSIEQRIGTRGRFIVRLEGTGLSLAEMEIPRYGHFQRESPGDSLGVGWTVELPAEMWEKVREGEESIRARVRLVIKDGRSGSVLVDEKTELTAKWTVEGKDAQTVELIKDEMQRAAMEKALKVEKVHVQARMLAVGVESRMLPQNLGMDVFVRIGQKEWKVGSVYIWGTGDTITWWVHGSVPEGFAGERADVVLRASAEAAMKSVDIFRIWDGEVVIKDVPVEWGKR